MGGTTEIPVEIRIIAATNKDLMRSIEERSFREDLYYRLKVFQITMPPLRERKDDVIALADHFLHLFNNKFRKNIRGIEAVLQEMLIDYKWPGNIRELRNVIERAVILETSEKLRKEHVPSEIIHAAKEKDIEKTKEQLAGTLKTDRLSGEPSLYEMEKETIRLTLEKAGFNQSKAAKLLGITRDTLRYKMKKYGL